MTKAPRMTGQEIDALLTKAEEAGRTAATMMTPPVMRIEGYAPILDGPCGFAWVNVKPANGQVAKALVAAGMARKNSYAGGVTVWVSEYNQSMARKEAHARAFANVLKNAGIAAYAGSRMD